MIDWQPGKTAPKDGTKFWGWLYDSGIHLMRWYTSQENAALADDRDHPEDYLACFVKVADTDDGDWSVKYWLPVASIPKPAGVVFDSERNRWRDEREPVLTGEKHGE